MAAALKSDGQRTKDKGQRTKDKGQAALCSMCGAAPSITYLLTYLLTQGERAVFKLFVCESGTSRAACVDACTDAPSRRPTRRKNENENEHARREAFFGSSLRGKCSSAHLLSAIWGLESRGVERTPDNADGCLIPKFPTWANFYPVHTGKSCQIFIRHRLRRRGYPNFYPDTDLRPLK